MEQTDPALSIEDLQAALRDMPTAMDITPADLQTLYTLAQHHAWARRATAGVAQAIMTTAVGLGRRRPISRRRRRSCGASDQWRIGD
jgi:CBS-domain-containing membrane protein